MASFVGKPVEFGRFLGFADYADPTNLPLGLSPDCRNIDFPLGSPRVRNGVVTTMQGIAAAPVTGLLSATYTPESASEPTYRLHAAFDSKGNLQAEMPDGSGALVPIARWAAAVLVTLPAGAHMIATQAYNRGYLSFANFTQQLGGRYSFVPASAPAVIDLHTKRVDPYGLRPYGDTWAAGVAYVVGEVVCPVVVGGNGHTYRCMVAGTSAAVEPLWPLADSANIVDGTVTWQEHTAVLANRVPAPAAPTLAVVGGGAFQARDVYVVVTALNPQGETIGSTAAHITVAANQAVSVTNGALAAWLTELPGQYAVSAFGVYEADVAVGAAAPPQSSFAKAGQASVGQAYLLTGPAAGTALPQRNSARLTPGMLPVPLESPVAQRTVAGGTFPAGRDVYFRKTYQNAAGETSLGPSIGIINTQLNDAVTVTIAGEPGYNVVTVGLYEADVATGAAEPNVSAYALVGYYAIAATPLVGSTAFGAPAPVGNTTGSRGNIMNDSSTGGANNTQGHRSAAIAFEDFTDTVSGIRQGAVVSTIIDEDGWGLAIFHVPTGPANVQRRLILPTVANGTTVGPFFLIDTLSDLNGNPLPNPIVAVSNGVSMTATVIPDNVSSSLQMDFTDTYLEAQTGTDYTYRLQTVMPKPCVDFYYAPSADRIFQSGVPGYSGHWVSRAADGASYQGDTGYITVGADGEKAYCVREFRETVYSLRERSGFAISASGANPNQWGVSRRWNKVGPCGPRAVDVGRELMIFVHRSGVYAYGGDGEPQNISKEIPNGFSAFWASINWQAAEAIWVAIDEDLQVCRIGLPIGQSVVPSKELAIWFPEGWAMPESEEQSGARRISINDIAANLGIRMERDLQTIEGDASYRASQFVYASSGADGTVQAIQPGRKDDNGGGINGVYETAAFGQGIVKVEGFDANILGEGEIQVSLLPERVTAGAPIGPANRREVRLRPMLLATTDDSMVSRFTPAGAADKWRMRFTNGMQPGAWFDLKELIAYVSPMFSGKTAGSSK